MRITSRFGFLLGFGFCAALLAVAAYFQFVRELEPCPLCITQRVFVLAVGIVFLMAVVHNPGRLGQKIYGSWAALLAIGGAAISARHVWLQNLPKEEVPACGPGLAYVFENFPLSRTLKLLLSGTGECSEVLWTFLGLSIPAWTLVAFVILAGWGLWLGWRKTP